MNGNREEKIEELGAGLQKSMNNNMKINNICVCAFRSYPHNYPRPVTWVEECGVSGS